MPVDHHLIAVAMEKVIVTISVCEDVILCRVVVSLKLAVLDLQEEMRKRLQYHPKLLSRCMKMILDFGLITTSD